MGELAGRYLQSKPAAGTVTFRNVAGDYLTGPEMADAFAAAQGRPCDYSRARVFEFLVRIFFRDLYSIIRYLRTMQEETNIAEFKGLVTSFAKFLEETSWGDAEKEYEQFASVQETLKL